MTEGRNPSSTDTATLPPLVDRLRRRASLVFLATEESPARDLSNHLIEAADTIDGLRAWQRARLEGDDAARAERDALVDALEQWLAYAEENLSEFDNEEPCTAEKLCPRCENSGCITLKIQETRAALSQVQP